MTTCAALLSRHFDFFRVPTGANCPDTGSLRDVAGDAEADDVRRAFRAVGQAERQAHAAAGLRGGRVPGAAAVDAELAVARAGRVALGHHLVIALVVAVPAPFRDVAVHVEQAERVGLLRA